MIRENKNQSPTYKMWIILSGREKRNTHRCHCRYVNKIMFLKYHLFIILLYEKPINLVAAPLTATVTASTHTQTLSMNSKLI